MSNSVTEIDPTTTINAIAREANKGLMVAFINHDLLNRASLDVKRSVVFYDADHLFEYAVSNLPDEAMLQRLADETAIRFWSKGI